MPGTWWCSVTSGTFVAVRQCRPSRHCSTEQLRGAEFFYNRMLIDGSYAFLQWRAVARDMHIPDGADSYVITDGRIQLQTISYTVTSKPMAVNTTPRVSD